MSPLLAPRDSPVQWTPSRDTAPWNPALSSPTTNNQVRLVPATCPIQNKMYLFAKFQRKPAVSQPTAISSPGINVVCSLRTHPMRPGAQTQVADFVSLPTPLWAETPPPETLHPGSSQHSPLLRDLEGSSPLFQGPV